MNILWLTNIILPGFAKTANLKNAPAGGGWLTGAAEALSKQKDIQLNICFPMQANDLCVKTADGIQYVGYPQSKKASHIYDPTTEEWFRCILQQVQPDLVHIWGTEFPQTLAMTKAFNNPDRTLISIQGICKLCYEHYNAQLPEAIQKKYTLRDFIRKDRIIDQRKNFAKRGNYEIQALGSVAHIIGRTQWDLAASIRFAPSAKYHFCNETLRNTFYQNSAAWDPEQCEQHSIFVSQASYPIKGFHMVLEAMPEILRRYPSARLYTTGTDPRSVPFYRINSYQKTLVSLIRKYGLQDRVTFLGTLNEQQMCERFLKSNVFVSASSIENSPNSVGEAMLLGVPTVASFVGGTMDLMKDKEEGYLYQADAPYLLAHYVCKVFNDKARAWEMGQRASQHANKTHNPKSNLEQLLRIYKEISLYT